MITSGLPLRESPNASDDNVSQQFAEWPNMVTRQLPKMMLLTITQSEALLGSHDTNPFFFHHFDLMHLSAEIDGKV